MILIDTHVWVWWVLGNDKFPDSGAELLKDFEAQGIGVSVISCWEVAKLVELKRLELPMPIDEWIAAALKYPGVTLLDLTVEIAIESTRLPGQFHRDPADQLLVATARCNELRLATADQKILEYEHVGKLDFRLKSPQEPDQHEERK